jgi:hypothetical protein
MGLFDNIGNASIGQGGNYLKSGHNYLLEVNKCLTKQGRKGDLFFIAEFTIHESDDTTNPPGFTASWTCNFKHDAALGNVLWFLGAVNGIDIKDEARLKNEITSQVAEFAVSAQNPLAGRMVEVEVHEVKTKAGTPFSKHLWKPTTRGPNEAARAARAAANAAPPSLSGFTSQAPAATLPTIPTSLPAPLMAAPPPPPVLAPPPPPVFPPPGWAAHPAAPGYFYRGQEVVTEAQLRAMR